MTKPTDSSSDEPASDEPGEPRISVRRVTSLHVGPFGQIRRAVRSALNGRSARSISVAIVDDACIASLHQRYLDDPRSTDVLTFDLRDDPADPILEGEIVVSAETARREAGRRRLPEAEELLRYVIHGTLHLSGYDDRTTSGRSQMRRMEDRVLAGLNRPMPPKRT